MYINAGKIRLREIYNDLKAGYELDGRGKRKKGDVRYAVDDNTTQNTEALGNLTPLTYKEYQNLTSNSNANYVHGYNSNLDSFINDAFTNPQSQNKTLYIGKIPQNVAQTIKSLSNSDVSNYSVVIRNGEINKIFNDHGSDLTEIPRGQIAVTPEILAKISEVISNPDKITIKKSTNDNKTVLDFEKRINGYAIATEVISDKRKTLRPITFYVINKKNPPTISNANSLAGNVQNESGTDSDTTIPQSNPDVKYSLDSIGRSLTQAQAEYFKDSKVRDAEGRLETVYHGTPNTFTEFNYNNIGSNGTAMGKGFYFVNNKDFASGYTTENGNIVEAYIDIKKPLSETKKTINELVYADDEDYQNLRDSDKDLNYLFKYGDNKWIKIPKGRITGTISAAALRTSRALRGDPDAWDGYLDTVINNIAPVNPLTSNIRNAIYITTDADITTITIADGALDPVIVMCDCVDVNICSNTSYEVTRECTRIVVTDGTTTLS